MNTILLNRRLLLKLLALIPALRKFLEPAPEVVQSTRTGDPMGGLGWDGKTGLFVADPARCAEIQRQRMHRLMLQKLRDEGRIQYNLKERRWEDA